MNFVSENSKVNATNSSTDRLYGVLVYQAIHYYATCLEDELKLKIFVSIILNRMRLELAHNLTHR